MCHCSKEHIRPLPANNLTSVKSRDPERLKRSDTNHSTTDNKTIAIYLSTSHHPSIHPSPIHPSTYPPPIHASTHSSVYPSIYPPTYHPPILHPFIHPPINHPFIHPPINLSACLPSAPTHQFIHQLIHPPTHSLIIHVSIQPSITH